ALQGRDGAFRGDGPCGDGDGRLQDGLFTGKLHGGGTFLSCSAALFVRRGEDFCSNSIRRGNGCGKPAKSVGAARKICPQGLWRKSGSFHMGKKREKLSTGSFPHFHKIRWKGMSFIFRIKWI